MTIKDVCLKRIKQHKITNCLVKETDIGRGLRPIIIKNNIAVAGQILSCSSPLLAHYKSPYNATIVNLIDDDYCIVGLSRMSEFAMGTTSLPDVKGLFDDKVCAGGSSGALAVAISCGMAPIGIGTDTGGSVIVPASLNGLYGFKPTFGAISRYGVVAMGSSYDHVALLSQTALESYNLYSTIQKIDRKDQRSIQIQDNNEDIKKWLQGKVCYYSNDFLTAAEAVHFDQVKQFLQHHGVDVQPDHKTLDMRLIDACYLSICTSELVSNLSRYGQCLTGRKNQDELRNQMTLTSKQRLALGVTILKQSQLFHKPAIKALNHVRTVTANKFKRCDLYIYSSRLPREDGLILRSRWANITYYPLVNIPVGKTGTIPFGVSIQGKPSMDYILLKIACLYNDYIKNDICYDPLPTY